MVEDTDTIEPSKPESEPMKPNTEVLQDYEPVRKCHKNNYNHNCP
jgi:hypothetical protein